MKHAIASYLGVAPPMVVTGCGSDDVLDSAIRAFGEPGDTVAFPVRLSHDTDIRPDERTSGIPMPLPRPVMQMPSVHRAPAPTSAISARRTIPRAACFHAKRSSDRREHERDRGHRRGLRRVRELELSGPAAEEPARRDRADAFQGVRTCGTSHRLRGRSIRRSSRKSRNHAALTR